MGIGCHMYGSTGVELNKNDLFLNSSCCINLLRPNQVYARGHFRNISDIFHMQPQKAMKMSQY
jgi:hypothetical protein